jgi:hypothetical protein
MNRRLFLESLRWILQYDYELADLAPFLFHNGCFRFAQVLEDLELAF